MEYTNLRENNFTEKRTDNYQIWRKIIFVF